MIINCFGDSLTAGTAFGNTLPYPTVLGELSGFKVNNYGIGGEASGTIAARIGAYPLIIQRDFTIPSQAAPVDIELVDKEGISPKILLQVQEDTGNDCINPIKICGIEGILQRNANGFTFTRSNSGLQVKVKSGERIVTHLATKCYNKDCNIIWAGTNDYTSMNNVELVINNIKSIINYLGSEKYLVIGMTAKSYMPEIAQVNDRLALEFGNHFYDFRSYILQSGLKDAGIEPTDADIEDINNGEIPISFIKAPEYDHVHGNESFFTLLGKEINDLIKGVIDDGKKKN